MRSMRRDVIPIVTILDKYHGQMYGLRKKIIDILLHDYSDRAEGFNHAWIDCNCQAVPHFRTGQKSDKGRLIDIAVASAGPKRRCIIVACSHALPL